MTTTGSWTSVGEYGLTLDPYAEPKPALRVRGGLGRELKKVPPALKRDPAALELVALADWIGDHAAQARTRVESWMTRSLPVTAALIRHVWPDPYWQRALRYAAVAPCPDGEPDVERTGLLTEVAAGPDGALELTGPDGRTELRDAVVAILHPVLLDPAGSGRLTRWQELLDEFGGEQGIEQLGRAVYVRPGSSPAPHRHVSHLQIRAFDGAAYNSGSRFERVVSRFGGRIHGESVTFTFEERGGTHQLRVGLRYQGPMAPVDIHDCWWDDAKGRTGTGAYDPVPRVVWSEGLRAVAALYDERDTEGRATDRRAELPADSGAAYQRYLIDCAAYGSAGRPAAEPAAARQAPSDSGLLGAGAVLGGAPAAPDEETLTAVRLDWPVLDEGHHLVRLVPARAVEGEQAVARALGLRPATTGAVPVGRIGVRPLDFLAQVSRVHPQHARQAMALLAPLRRCAETAPAKPGRAATQLQQTLEKLTATTPELLPFALYEGAKVVAGAGSPAMAAPLFTEARRLEEAQGGRVDDDALAAVFAEFTRLGVVSAKLLQEHRKGLAARLSPAETADRYLRLVLVWCRAGREVPRSFAEDLARAADGMALPADEDHIEILDALLHRGGMDRTPLAVWQSWEPALAALTAGSPAAGRRALRLMAAPRGTSAAAKAATAEGWLELLRRTGLLFAITGETAPGAPASLSGPAASDARDSGQDSPSAPASPSATPSPSPPPSPGELASPAAVTEWLGLFLEQYQGMKQPVTGLDAVLAAVARRLREAGGTWKPPRGLTSHGPTGPAVDLDLLALMSRAGMPWAEPHAHVSLDVVRWLASKGPAAVEEIAADPVLRPVVGRELVVRGYGRGRHVAAAHPLTVAPRGLAALRRSRPLTTVVEEGAEELAQRLHESGGAERPMALLDLLVHLEPFHAAGLTGPFARPAKEAAEADAAVLLAAALTDILGGAGRDATVSAGHARELLAAVAPEVHEECRDRIVRGRAGQHVYTVTSTAQALAGLVVRMLPGLSDDDAAARPASAALQQALVCEIRQEDLRRHLA
jgi:hypothetical protein